MPGKLTACTDIVDFTIAISAAIKSAALDSYMICPVAVFWGQKQSAPTATRLRVSLSSATSANHAASVFNSSFSHPGTLEMTP